MQDRSIANEREALLKKVKISGFNHKTISEFLKSSAKGLKIVDTGVEALQGYTVPSAMALPFGAYKRFPNANLNGNLAGIPSVLIKLVLDLAAKKKIKNAEKINHIADGLITGASTAYFFLLAYIAVYIAAYADKNKIGEDEVDVSTLAYLLAFILPSILVGATHTALELTKKHFSASDTHLAKTAKWLHGFLTVLYQGSNLDSFLLPVLALFNINITGKENPNVRLGIFLLSFLVAIVMAIAQLAGFTKMEKFFDYSAAGFYISSIFSQPARQQLSKAEFGSFIGFFVLLATVSGWSVMCLNPAKEKDPLSLNIQERRSTETNIPAVTEIQIGDVNDLPNSNSGIRGSSSSFFSSSPIEIKAQPAMQANSSINLGSS